MIGEKFTKLEVIERFPENKGNRSQWICKCDCGNEKIVLGKLLLNGHVKSCGCLNDQRRRERSKENHPNWKGGTKIKGSLAWANIKLKVLENISQERNYSSPNFNSEKVIELYNQSEERCEICNLKIKSLCLDHCHKTGQLRGFLCNNCNTGLGSFKDSPELMIKAIKYLKKHFTGTPPVLA